MHITEIEFGSCAGSGLNVLLAFLETRAELVEAQVSANVNKTHIYPLPCIYYSPNHDLSGVFIGNDGTTYQSDRRLYQ